MKTLWRKRMLAGSIPLVWPIAACTCAWAQVPGAAPQDTKSVSVSKIERKNKAPVSKEILRVKLPKPFEATLENGLTILIMEDHRLPTVSLQLSIIGAGPLYEPANQAGLASATAQMLREGTKTRSSKQLAEDVDKLGATLNASAPAGSEAATLTASGLSENFDDWFALLTDVLIRPTFPTAELAKLKQRLVAGLKQQRSQASFLAQERFNRAVFGSHPASVVSASEATISAFTSEALSNWHRQRYTPQNAILGIAGDVSPAELMPKLKNSLAAWQKTDLKVTLPANPSPAKSKKIYLVDRPNSVQTTLGMGNIAIDRRDPDYVPMVVMNRVLGEGPAARLFLNLREEKGYTYGVYSAFTALKYPGAWRAGGDLRTEVTEGAMNEFLKEFNRIRNEKVPEDELDDAKRAVVANFALSLEQPAQLLGYAITRKIYNFPADYWDKYPAAVLAVTAEDVQRVARKYINPENMQIVAVGDGSKIKAVMEKFGPVEVYDIEGKATKSAPAAAQVR